jgi:hypothetical protein
MIVPIEIELGTRFGILTVIERAGKDKGNNRLFKCVCDCGKIIVTRGTRLKNKIHSCGCKARVTHGQTGSKEHKAWVHIRDRCGNPNNKSYKNYGAKGIMVCPRWLESFENFFADMGPAPSRNHTLDRFPNNKGNYEPGNCRWANWHQQQGNRTNNRWIEYNGERMILQDWVRKLKLNTLGYHLDKGRSMAYIIKNFTHVNASAA